MLDHQKIAEANASSLEEGAQDVQVHEEIRFDWTIEEIMEIMNLPFPDLMDRARALSKRYEKAHPFQLARLLSIKTGACPEDCKYCAQSAHYAKKVGLKVEPLISVEEVLEKAQTAKNDGAHRFCMGAAWREVRVEKDFEKVLQMVQGVKDLGLEPCCTLGMITQEQAHRLKEAGLKSYNHNLDTSPEFYSKVITTRTFEERLTTLENARNAGLSLCTGGIIGLGETLYDRARLLQVLASMSPHPESVPINALVAVEGTPMGKNKPVEALELARMIATARILMPLSYIRLSAGRKSLSLEAQLMCLYAGADSFFHGEKLLTTENAEEGSDAQLLKEWGYEIAIHEGAHENLGPTKQTGCCQVGDSEAASNGASCACLA